MAVALRRALAQHTNAQGHITQNWSSHTRDYAAATAEVKWEDYAVRERALAAE